MKILAPLLALVVLSACVCTGTTPLQKAQQDKLARDAAAQADPNPARDDLERIQREVR
ncbi:MAG TPA: hypothetical protein PLO23_06135 [Alphaproteobacteria bacterium]|nr:hypothetical protein [Alphaproteobacteria bacterium]